VTDYLRETGAHIAAKLPAVMVLLAFLAAAVLFHLWRLQGNGAPARRSRRVTGWLARFVLMSALVALGVFCGPMRPLFSSASRLDGRVGKPVPEMEFRRVADDVPERLGDYRGKVVLVNLWATWCPPCRRELPVLNRLQETYRGRGLDVITLSDEKRDALAGVVGPLAPAAVNGYVQSYGWLAIRDFRPFTLVIDRQGILRDYLFGDQDYAVFERQVLRYLD
jgi:thiol-disulfide isomerase/thioredoxin